MPEDPTDIDDIAIGTIESEIAELLRSDESASLLEQFIKSSFLWFPAGVLIVTLVWFQYGALLTGFYSTIATIPVTFIQRLILTESRSSVTFGWSITYKYQIVS